jgi:hypothetical protein
MTVEVAKGARRPPHTASVNERIHHRTVRGRPFTWLERDSESWNVASATSDRRLLPCRLQPHFLAAMPLNEPSPRRGQSQRSP